MMGDDCSMREAVLANASALTPELNDHVANCPTCKAALSAHRWMNTLSAETLVPTLPDPGRIWLKATLLRARASAEEATRPIDIVQRITYTLLVAAWVGAGMWQLPHLVSWFHRIRTQQFVTSAASTMPFSPEMFLVFAGLVLVTITMSIHALLQQE